VPTPPTSALSTYAIALNLTKPAAEVRNAAQFLSQIDPTLHAVEIVIHVRCQELFRARRGTLYGERPLALTKVDSVEHLEAQLRDGAVWMDDRTDPGKFRCELKEWPDGKSISHATPWAAGWAPPVFPALATKLYQESNLRELPSGRQA
jgi:hypothetical protein